MKIACRHNIYAYDAYYLETARRLNLPLVTFDRLMRHRWGWSLKSIFRKKPGTQRKAGMRVFNYSEARQNFSTLLNTALKEDVIIRRKDGSRFRLISMHGDGKEQESPLENIKGVKTNVTMSDILEAIKDGHE